MKKIMKTFNFKKSFLVICTLFLAFQPTAFSDQYPDSSNQDECLSSLSSDDPVLEGLKETMQNRPHPPPCYDPMSEGYPDCYYIPSHKL